MAGLVEADCRFFVDNDHRSTGKSLRNGSGRRQSDNASSYYRNVVFQLATFRRLTTNSDSLT